MLHPGIEDRLEGVLGRKLDSVPLLLAIGVRVDALGQQGSGFVSQDAGIAQADLWVITQRDALLLAEPVVTEVPRLAADR